MWLELDWVRLGLVMVGLCYVKFGLVRNKLGLVRNRFGLVRLRIIRVGMGWLIVGGVRVGLVRVEQRWVGIFLGCYELRGVLDWAGLNSVVLCCVVFH